MATHTSHNTDYLKNGPSPNRPDIGYVDQPPFFDRKYIWVAKKGLKLLKKVPFGFDLTRVAAYVLHSL
jgi:hypothetical protein